MRPEHDTTTETERRPVPVGREARTWFITGAGRGLGRAFTDAALGVGDRVVACVRDPDRITPFAPSTTGRVHLVRADVRDREAVRRAVGEAIDWAGTIDVVVNNAGHGLVGAVEELGEAEVRAQLDTNLLGPLWVCQAVLPHLRARGSGHIVQVSTTGAVGSMPTLGAYNASKWGMEGFSEALAAEVAPFGIRVTIAELGGFATDWGGASMRFAEPNADYDALRTSLFGTAEVPWPSAGSGADDDPHADADADAVATDDAATDADPAVAAAALLAHVDRPEGPLRLLVGDDAPDQVAMALDARRVDYAQDPRLTWPVG